MNQAILEQKKQAVEDLANKVKDSASMVVVEYRGLNVAETTELRRTLRGEDVSMSVYKNGIVSRALESLGYEDMAKEITGPNAFVFGKDAVAPARILAKFAKTHKNLVLKTGIVDGKTVDEAGLKELSSLPNKEGMIAMFAGCLTYPVGSFARALKAVADSRPEDYTPVKAAEEKVEEVKEEVKEAAEEVKEAVEEKAEEVKEEAKEAVEEVKEAVEEAK